MQSEVNRFTIFFYSQAFADGFRTTLAILLPAVISTYLNHFDIGLMISLGALCVNLADAPGPFIHKRNGMLICSGFLFLVAVTTALARNNVYTMGLEIALVCFFFSMFNVYGARATSVGNAAILLMILSMDKPIPLDQVLPTSFYIFLGGIFYTSLSLLLYRLQPYRIAQRTLAESIREIAKYLSIKADFYNKETDINNDYRRLVSQQIVVNEKQDAVRELLFKTRQIVNETTTTGRKLVWTFVETVDLFEGITASYYDYELLRKQFLKTGILDSIADLIKKMAAELDRIGISIQANTSFTPTFNYDEALKGIRDEIEGIQQNGINTLLLKKILVNLRSLFHSINDINKYFEKGDIKRSKIDHTLFITHQSLDPKILWNNLSYNSSVFKHAIRVSLGCIAGFLIAKLLSYGHHSYWILMTIAFMLKPAFSLTKQRNIQRIIGTFVGGGVGLLILLFIPNKNIQFALMILFMLGTYSFMRIDYLAMVLCTTPYILILFKFLGMGFLSVAKERVLDTVLGCTIAFIASYFLFPHWESSQLKTYIQNMLRSNARYLSKIVELLMGKPVPVVEYKLARKEVYVSSANLSSAFQRMISEPKSKQTNQHQVHQFVVLNHILLSNIATMATSLMEKEVRHHPAELSNESRKAMNILNNSIKKLGGDPICIEEIGGTTTVYSGSISNPDDVLFKEQLDFICRLCFDIDKNVNSLLLHKPLQG